MDGIKTGAVQCPAKSRTVTYVLVLRCPVYRGRDSPLGLRAELENLPGRCEGKRPKRTTREAESTEAPLQGRTTP